MKKLSNSYADWSITGMKQIYPDPLELTLSLYNSGVLEKEQKLHFKEVKLGWLNFCLRLNDIWEIRISTGEEVSNKIINDKETMKGFRAFRNTQDLMDLIKKIEEERLYYVEIEGNSGFEGKFVCEDFEEIEV